MKGYFYGLIASVIFLAVFESVIPKSENGKPVKAVVSLLALLIITVPVIKMLGSGFFTGSESADINESFTNKLSEIERITTESEVYSLLKTEKFPVKKVKAAVITSDGKIFVKKIVVFYDESVIKENENHIYILENAKELIKSRLYKCDAEVEFIEESGSADG